MKKVMSLIFLLITFPLMAQSTTEEKKIEIYVNEMNEEVPNYKTFQIKAVNPTSQEKTIVGKILFENGESCIFLFELNPNEQKKGVRHCKVSKRRLNYKVEIEKIYDFIIPS